MHDIDELNDPARINKEEFKKILTFMYGQKILCKKIS